MKELDFSEICKESQLPEYMIMKLANYLPWNTIYLYQDLSIDFAMANEWRINWEHISRSKHLTEEKIILYVL